MGLRYYYEGDEERAAAKAEGAALVLSGVPLKRAAEEVGVDRRTLGRVVARLAEAKATDADLRAADQAVMALAYQIAERAQARLLERVEAGTMEDKDTVQSVAQTLKAIGSYRKWHKPEPDPDTGSTTHRILDRLELALASGASLGLTITPPAPDHRAVDVEASESE